MLYNLSFISMCRQYKSIEEISQKLLQLHVWSWYPSLVVVDLSHIIQLESTQSTAFSTPLIQKVSFCAVALLTYLQSIAWHKERNKAIKTLNGLLIVTLAGDDSFGHKHLQTIKDLYFYKTDLYNDLKHVTSLVLEEK